MALNREERLKYTRWKGEKPSDQELQEILIQHRLWISNFYGENTNFKVQFGERADLSGADLRDVNILSTDLRHAELNHADLSRADLCGVDFRHAHLQYAILSEAYCSDIHFPEFNRVDFRGAHLNHADLSGARLCNVKLNDADLRHANLSDANLVEADLRGTDLRHASFKEANVTSVNYDPVNLKCRGINAATCFGSLCFRRDLMDQDYIDEFKEHHPYLAWVWRVSSDYGRSLKRWALWSFFLAFIFAYIFTLMGTKAFKVPIGTYEVGFYWVQGFKDLYPNMSFDFLTMLYYSIVTFTTLGFGDVTPLNKWAALAVTVEVIIGYIMLGGLISIFANKLARRAG